MIWSVYAPETKSEQICYLLHHFATRSYLQGREMQCLRINQIINDIWMRQHSNLTAAIIPHLAGGDR
jgi:hypothetical protein